MNNVIGITFGSDEIFGLNLFMSIPIWLIIVAEVIGLIIFIRRIIEPVSLIITACRTTKEGLHGYPQKHFYSSSHGNK